MTGNHFPQAIQTQLISRGIYDASWVITETMHHVQGCAVNYRAHVEARRDMGGTFAADYCGTLDMCAAMASPIREEAEEMCRAAVSAHLARCILSGGQTPS